VGGAEVPLFERFFLGGLTASGVPVPVPLADGPEYGGIDRGNKELIVNLEYLFPLISEIAFKGVLFFDAGNAWAQGDWPFSDQGVWAAYGVGVRWYSRWGRCASR